MNHLERRLRALAADYADWGVRMDPAKLRRARAVFEKRSPKQIQNPVPQTLKDEAVDSYLRGEPTTTTGLNTGSLYNELRKRGITDRRRVK
jgi:hypothetical protein